MKTIDFTGKSQTLNLEPEEVVLLQNVKVLQNLSVYSIRFSYREINDTNKGIVLGPNTLALLGGENIYIKAKLKSTIAVEGE